MLVISSSGFALAATLAVVARAVRPSRRESSPFESSLDRRRRRRRREPPSESPPSESSESSSWLWSSPCRSRSSDPLSDPLSPPSPSEGLRRRRPPRRRRRRAPSPVPSSSPSSVSSVSSLSWSSLSLLPLSSALRPGCPCPRCRRLSAGLGSRLARLALRRTWRLTCPARPRTSSSETSSSGAAAFFFVDLRGGAVVGSGRLEQHHRSGRRLCVRRSRRTPGSRAPRRQRWPSCARRTSSASRPARRRQRRQRPDRARSGQARRSWRPSWSSSAADLVASWLRRLGGRGLAGRRLGGLLGRLLHRLLGRRSGWAPGPGSAPGSGWAAGSGWAVGSGWATGRLAAGASLFGGRSGRCRALVSSSCTSSGSAPSRRCWSRCTARRVSTAAYAKSLRSAATPSALSRQWDGPCTNRGRWASQRH